MSLKGVKEFFQNNGYVIAPQLFNRDEVKFYADYYMDLRNHPKVRRDTNFSTATATDPLVQYPRLMQMHRWDETTRKWLLDPRINQCMTTLLDREPLAVQTMVPLRRSHRSRWCRAAREQQVAHTAQEREWRSGSARRWSASVPRQVRWQNQRRG